VLILILGALFMLPREGKKKHDLKANG